MVPSLTGLSYLGQTLPGTAVPGFHVLCLRHWSRGKVGTRDPSSFVENHGRCL